MARLRGPWSCVALEKAFGLKVDARNRQGAFASIATWVDYVDARVESARARPGWVIPSGRSARAVVVTAGSGECLGLGSSRSGGGASTAAPPRPRERRFDASGPRTLGGVRCATHPPSTCARAFPSGRLTGAGASPAAALEAVGQARLPQDLCGITPEVLRTAARAGCPMATVVAQEACATGLPRPGRAGVAAVDGPGERLRAASACAGPVDTVSSGLRLRGAALPSALGALAGGGGELAVAGGADALCLTTYAGFNALRSVDASACRPFQRSRAGLSIGEGAAVLVLETAQSALRRGAVPLAEVAGAGASCDAHHMTAPLADGAAAARAAARPGDAGLTPDCGDYS